MANGYKFNPATGRNGVQIGGAGFNRQAAGRKAYGSGRPYPNAGKTTDKAGYNEREARKRARKNAVLRRLGGM
jgi:hypothetical protein